MVCACFWYATYFVCGITFLASGALTFALFYTELLSGCSASSHTGKANSVRRGRLWNLRTIFAAAGVPGAGVFVLINFGN